MHIPHQIESSMKKPIPILLAAILIAAPLAFAEVGTDLRVTIFDGFDRTSLGVNGLIFPQKFSKDKMSIGFDFGIQLVEKHLYETEVPPLYTVTYTNSSDTDYVLLINKNYRDYMFMPLGVVCRYDLGDPENLSRIRVAVFLGAGGVLNVYTTSFRQIQDWYDDEDLNVYLGRDAVQGGGESIGKFDFYIKPKIALYWNRVYLSYEYYLNTEYMRHSIGIGYVFRL